MNDYTQPITTTKNPVIKSASREVLGGHTFTQLFDCVVERYSVVVAAVFGKVYRYAQMKRGRCTASQTRIADELGLSRQTVNAHLNQLVTDKFLIDLTPNRANGPHEYRLGPAFKSNGVKNFDTAVKRAVKGGVKGAVKNLDSRCQKSRHEESSKILKETQETAVVGAAKPRKPKSNGATATAELSESLGILGNAGVGKKKAEALAHLPHVTTNYIRAHVDYFQAEQERLNKIGQPLKGIGLLITRIAEGDPEPKPIAPAVNGYDYDSYAHAEESEAVETLDELSAPVDDESGHSEWVNVLTKLNGTLGTDAAQALAACHQVSATGQFLVIGVPNQQTRDWLDNRLRSKLENEAGKIIEFVVGTSVPIAHTNGTHRE